VQRRLPEVREPYIMQARRTLRRAFDAGDRDPRLLTTMGLCEIDAANEDGARRFLESAVAAGVVRPRAYHELARLRFAELRRGVPATASFSFTALAPIFDVLRRGLAQHPALPESFVLLAEAWARCELSPNPSEFAELETGARLFGRDPAVGLPLALALARHGRKAEAAAVLDAGAGYPADDATRAGIARLRGELPDQAPAAQP
jgi:Flp pilus assembly protein TadD